MTRTFAALLLLLVAGCNRTPKHHVDRVRVTGPTVSDNPLLALDSDGVQSRFENKLSANSHFVFNPDQPKPTRSVDFKVELSYTREAQKDGRKGTWAEVGATAEVKRKRKGEEARHDEVAGNGEVEIKGDSAEARRKAVQEALDEALEQLVVSSDLMLSAYTKPDKALVSDLKSEDKRVSEFALRALAERKNPVVVDALIEKLKSNDGIEVRRAIGALVELREPKAVPVMIDLARNRDASFLREIVFALGAIGGEEAEAYLFTVAQGHDQPEVQAAAEQAMAELRARTPRPAQ